MATLHYFHDPMCSWCWGYRPTWESLKLSLPSSVSVIYQLGGLAADSDKPMPTAMKTQIEQIWRRIEVQLGTEFNFDFWRVCSPRRSTYPACRAVIAAKSQGKEKEMILAIQEAYYLKAQNPSDDSTLTALAKTLGLDSALFEQDLNAPETQRELISQVEFAHNLGVPGYPSLVLEKGGERFHIPVNYADERPTLDLIESHLEGGD